MAHHPLEDAMKLGIAAKARFEGCIEHRDPLSSSINVKEALDTLTIAKINES
jgi:hypothetical protein